MKNIQTNLLSAFESSGLTYDELSRRTSLPKSALYRYLNGDTEKIPIDRFQALCHELNLDAGVLLGWREEPAAAPAPDIPQTSEARILARGIDRLPPEEREQALAVVRAIFHQHSDYFKEQDDET